MSAAVRVETRRYRMADLGGESPLPMLAGPHEEPPRFDASVPEAIAARAAEGPPRSLHPYRAQDRYRRDRTERATQAVVLENERLTAVFLPELGGRLWELVDRSTGAPVVHTPPAIQFANLALRNAWFAGGIEFNIGTRGHSPTTCSPLHAALVPGPDGTPVLRMWEHERLRDVVLTIDAWLPPGSPALLVRVTIRSTGAATVPMYWWTNAAVRQEAGTRVLAPAASAFRSDSEGGVTRVDPRNDDGADCTWPARSPSARDYFFDVPTGRRPWVAAVDARGRGLALLSTAALPGRKLFTWGSGPGGRRWQRWLDPEGDATYFEIQSGLTPTQFEHVPLASGEELAWTESYSSADLDPAVAHGADWEAALAHCEQRLADRFSALQAADAALARLRDVAPGDPIVRGSGWGALEQRRRAQAGEPWPDDPGAPFRPDAMGDEQRPWLELLRTGRFAGAESFVAGEGWRRLLEASTDTAATRFHLATLAHADGRLQDAATAYERALQQSPSALVFRGLALVRVALGDDQGAAEAHEAACAAAADDESILIEAATALLASGMAARALALLERAPGVRAGRSAFLLALAAVRTGDRERAAAILDGGLEVPDLREGEDSLAELWREVSPDRHVPEDYRFDMRETDPSGR